jgi:hypothetical protein
MYPERFLPAIRFITSGLTPGRGAASMEEAASRIVTYLYEDQTDRRGGQRARARSCASTRPTRLASSTPGADRLPEMRQ